MRQTFLGGKKYVVVLEFFTVGLAMISGEFSRLMHSSKERLRL